MIFSTVVFSVTCLVATKSLIGRKSLVTDRALVGDLRGYGGGGGGIRCGQVYWWWWWGGVRGATAGEHDEAESEIFFLGGVWRKRVV